MDMHGPKALANDCIRCVETARSVCLDVKTRRRFQGPVAARLLKSNYIYIHIYIYIDAPNLFSASHWRTLANVGTTLVFRTQRSFNKKSLKLSFILCQVAQKLGNKKR